MTLLREAIGESLRRARIAQSRTLREVSTSARVSLGYLSEVERGRKEASSELLAAICQALDVPLSQVLVDVSATMADADAPGPRDGDRRHRARRECVGPCGNRRGHPDRDSGPEGRETGLGASEVTRREPAITTAGAGSAPARLYDGAETDRFSVSVGYGWFGSPDPMPWRIGTQGCVTVAHRRRAGARRSQMEAGSIDG